MRTTAASTLLRYLFFQALIASIATVAYAQAPVPSFSKSFAPNSISAGTTSTLTFTIDATTSLVDLTALDFTDVLPAGVSVAPIPNASTSCSGGTLTAVAGTGTIAYTGGVVFRGSICTVSASVTSITVGGHLNTSGDLTSSAGNSGPASDTLTVTPGFLSPPGFTKAFGPPVIISGGVSTLTFTIDNTSNSAAADSLDFTDNLPAGVVVATPNNATTTCTGGTLTAIPGAGTINYSGGGVAAGSACTVNVDSTSSTVGAHINVSGLLTSSISGSSGPATDTLTVSAAATPPGFSKVFLPDTVNPGGITELTFTIDNTSNGVAATSLDFTDNLPAGVVVATPLRAITNCTGGTLTAVAGGGTIAYSGGTVPAISSCVVNVDTSSSTIGVHVNTSGDLTSVAGNSGPATDTLTVSATVTQPGFSKLFAPGTIDAGGVSTLTFSIDNTANVVDVTALDFTDNLPAGVVVATVPNASTTCTGGTLTATAGTGIVAYTGGTVPAGAICTVSADVTSPTAGAHLNTSGNLTSSAGLTLPATDTLNVNPVPPPIFGSAFGPATINVGATSTLTFTVDNTAGGIDVTALDFTDNLPAGVVVATPPNAMTTCTGGTLTAAAAGTVIAYTGGTVAAGATCTVSADVTSNTIGSHVNTSGDLTSSAGNSGSTAATLTVSAAPVPPAFGSAFAPDPIIVGNISTLTFTIDNTASTVDATALDFTDNLPAGVEVAAAPNAATTCTGGTLTAAAAGTVIAYTGGTVAAGASCTVVADVTSITPGTYVNTSGDLTSSTGNSGPAVATLIVNAAPVPALGPVWLAVLASLLGIVAFWQLRLRP